MNAQTNNSEPIPPLNDWDHTRGSINAPVLLMKYGDFQCPQSAQAYFTIKVMQQQLGDQFCFSFRHFPQPQIHPQAQKAAETSEAASVQGRFWEMHDILFENQQALEDADLIQYAAQIGLDIPRVLRELAEHVHAERVQVDINSGRCHGVESTPTFFIGIRHKGTQNLEVLLNHILKMTKNQLL